MAAKERMAPMRTCCGCGRRDAQGGMVRIIRTAAGKLALDSTRRCGGRGGYLHRAPACWDAFVRGKAFLPSLRVRVGVTDRRALVAELNGMGGKTAEQGIVGEGRDASA